VAIPALPLPFQQPVPVAARVYRGIHGEIRRLGYDNLRQRAHTSVPTKLALASLALWDLRTARSIHGWSSRRPNRAWAPCRACLGRDRDMRHRRVVRWIAGVVLTLVLTTLTAAAQ
jgi:hypothetical protein